MKTTGNQSLRQRSCSTGPAAAHNCRSLASLSDLILDEILNFDHQNVSHALSRLAKMFQQGHGGRTRGAARQQQQQPRPPSSASSSSSSSPSPSLSRQQQLAELRPAVEVLTRRMHQLIRNYDSWDVTLSLWAYGQLGYHDEAALRALCEAALAVTPLFKPADCVNAVVAFAYLDFLHTELLRQIVAVMLDTLDDFQPGEVCQVLWSFAKLGCHPGATLLHEAVASVHGHVRQYGTQELVLVLWSLVRLGYKPGVRFLYDVETTLLQRLPHMAPSDLSLSVWTFAHLRYKAVRLLDEVPAAVGPQLRNCSNAELCSLASGFATAHHYHRVLLDAVAGVVLSRIETLTHQEVCVVLWTYGTFRHRPSQADFSKQVAATLYARMPYFAPQGLAMIVKALAQLQWRSEPLLVALMQAAEAKLNGFKPLELSQLLWGLSALQCKDLGIYYAVVRRCIAILKDPLHPHYRTMMHHRVVNSVIASCQQLGYVPWTLIDFAESKGIRVKEPGILSSRDEDDEGMVLATPQPGAAAAAHRAASFAWEEEEQEAMGRGRREDDGVGDDAEDVEEDVEEEEEDVGSSMVAAVAGGLGSGRRLRRSSEPLLLLQQQVGDPPQQQQGGSQHEQAAQEPGPWRQERRLHHPETAAAVDVPTPLDQHSPLRVGFPPGHRPGHGHGHHHGHRQSHAEAQPHGSQSGGEDTTAAAAAKVLIPRPRALRRPAAGDPAGGGPGPGSSRDPDASQEQQQQQQWGRARQQRCATAAAAVAAPVALSPPPAALPLQQRGGASANGNGNGHGLPEAPWVALEG
ncbi:hypothetical protein PLESTF_001459100 [Pleodorina starrii]|nr:hypothetical protein PLESTF_001459100 [Pleodorina starrii]